MHSKVGVQCSLPVQPYCVAINDEIEACFDEQEPCDGTCGWLTFFAECATDCTSADAKENSEAVVDTISQSTEMVEDLRDLLDEQAMPFL